MGSLKGLQRFDLGQIGDIERTPQGFLKVPGFATRTGVFSYRDAKGDLRRELRHPDDVFDPASLKTLKNAPVTLEHPPVMLTPDNVGEYMMGYTTERVEVNRDLVETDLIIAGQAAVDAIEAGTRELSSGYLADLEEEHGVYNGTEYDYRQRNIIYNHLAIVKRGRAGPEVRLRLDSEDAAMEVVVETPAAEFQPEGENDSLRGDEEKAETRTVAISGRTVEMPGWLADIWDDMSDRYDEMRGQIMKMEESMDRKDVDVSQKNVSPQVKVEQKAPDGRGAGGKVGPSDRSGPAKAKGLDAEEDKKKDADLEKKEDGEVEEKKEDGEEESEKKDFQGPDAGASMSPVDLLKSELAEMQAKHDALQAKVDEYASASMAGGEKKMDSADTVKKSVRKRVRLEITAGRLVPDSVAAKFDSMSDEEIMASVIKHRHPKAELTGKSPVYLESRFDSIVEATEGSETVRREMGSHLLGGRMDSEPVDPAAKRREMIENSRKLYTQSLSASKK